MSHYSKLTDQDLTGLLVSGDESAFTEIYTRYWRRLFTLAANKIHNLEEAEEIVQDIFISLWSRRQLLTVEKSLHGYLATAVKYRVITKLNRSFHAQKYAVSLNQEDLLDHSTEQWIEFEELRTRLNKLVSTLPEKCRLVYTLSKEEGHSQKKIATDLKISEKTVEAHLARAMRSLRAGLTHLLMFF
ncbi:MAG TPA: RNA polymerase sigma-70 factor [Sphingobacteriaceae bacterium]